MWISQGPLTQADLNDVCRVMASFLDLLFIVLRELGLFAAVGFLIGGLDELAVDLLWVGRRLAGARAQQWMRVDSCPTAALPRLRYAVMVPAWYEANVIGQMIDANLRSYRNSDVVLFVGCYPNDPETLAVVRGRVGPRVRLVVGTRLGPTTKADCLNTIWTAILEARSNGQDFDAVILHDAEDLASPLETRVFDEVLVSAAAAQLPVEPTQQSRSRWISGHYCDEFAEAHGKTLVVRSAIGAAVPLAGVGCAIRVDVLDRLAGGGLLLDDGSLTEDYELGLRLAAEDMAPVFVRARDAQSGRIIATCADFPATLEDAIRQKTRWTIGIGLAGWDRMRWGRGFAENWMRLRDRRVLIAAIVLVAGYAAVLLAGLLSALHLATGRSLPVMTPTIQWLLSANALLLVWRLVVRAALVWRVYGPAEAARSVPRMLVGNVVAIVSARRSVTGYVRMRAEGRVVWDKTSHSFSGASHS